jgi:hypothetical protein
MSDEKRRAGDMVGKGSAWAELFYGSLSGMAFGLISPVAGQPFDVIKTKMQADPKYQGGALSTARGVISAEGLRGLYRGLSPILASTGVQKTVLFAAYAGSRRVVEESEVDMLVNPIPGSHGLRPSILIGGVMAAAARTVVETPFELAKVRWQTGGSIYTGKGFQPSWAQLTELYTGAPQTFYRAALMLGFFFVTVDYTERLAPDLMAVPLLGGFFKGGVCATIGWGLAWPFEVAKSLVQSNQGVCGSTLTILGDIVRRSGPAGLWRGFLPGAMRSIVANGAGMAVYQLTQVTARG